jgi:hypothetical protein
LTSGGSSAADSRNYLHGRRLFRKICGKTSEDAAAVPYSPGDTLELWVRDSEHKSHVFRLWREFREGRRLRLVILEPNPRISVVWLQDLLESVCGAAAAMARSPNPRQSLFSGCGLESCPGDVVVDVVIDHGQCLA